MCNVSLLEFYIIMTSQLTGPARVMEIRGSVEAVSNVLEIQFLPAEGRKDSYELLFVPTTPAGQILVGEEITTVVSSFVLLTFMY